MMLWFALVTRRETASFDPAMNSPCDILLMFDIIEGVEKGELIGFEVIENKKRDQGPVLS